MAPTEYLIQAFDSNHMWLDTDDRHDGYSTFITGAGPMLRFIAATKRGTLRDCDAETATVRNICYWVISVGVPREIYVTPYGATCTRTVAGIKNYGPGCHAPRPVPTI